MPGYKLHLGSDGGVGDEPDVETDVRHNLQNSVAVSNIARHHTELHHHVHLLDPVPLLLGNRHQPAPLPGDHHRALKDIWKPNYISKTPKKSR